ncbi:hypothetical protein LTR56_000285 [Elasticomyces elasticus]|nr:hypothetical protein LTR56_000285 [Elasticomyces elasticus]KAK3667020.1 hypothetical protein LTR22_002245 [Elasticomyces elasticus]KAK4933277.1 hypothetical protein LTR49_000271 [Elasticomyces elasticus]KAK5757369.1 hypothetical protein LTS12_012581 [Elasticomyces elasticus]
MSAALATATRNIIPTIYVRPLTSSPIHYLGRPLIRKANETTVAKNRAPRVPKADAIIRPDVGLAERQSILEASLQKVKKKSIRREKGDKTASPPSSDEPGLATVQSVPVDQTKPKRRTAKPKAAAIPPRLLPPVEQKHHDLPSFLTHAASKELSTTSTVYKGTHFEYTVAAALSNLNFTLQRTGRSNDLGIDLVGQWSLPTERKKRTYEVPVIVQCKAARPTPSMIRELEGAYTGAPAGWCGDGVLALLVNVHPSTKGVREAVQRSRWPLGVLQVTRDGAVKQFLWNAVAAEVGLEGLGVTVRHASKRGGMLEASEEVEKGDEAANTTSSIGLTWMGELWRPAGGQIVEEEAAATAA